MKKIYLTLMIGLFLLSFASAAVNIRQDGDTAFSTETGMTKTMGEFMVVGAKFTNEGNHTSIDTDLGIHNDEEPTSYLGIYGHNPSAMVHANLILEAGIEGRASTFNLIKNSPLHPFAPNASGITNEGSYGTFVPVTDRISWSNFDNLTKDSMGNILSLNGISRLMMLNSSNLYLEQVGLNVNGSVTVDGGNIVVDGGDIVALSGNIIAYGENGESTNFMAGWYAGTDTPDLSRGIGIGYNALWNSTATDRVIAIGFDAGSNSSGNNGLYLGDTAGLGETEDNKFWVSNILNNLIEGDFDNQWLKVLGDLNVTDNLTVDGITNMAGLLSADGNIDIDNSGAIITMTGDGSGFTNAAIVMQSEFVNPDVRGLGIYMFDQAGEHEWYAGTPYWASDRYVIYRQENISTHKSNTSSSTLAGVEKLFTIRNDGDVGIGTDNPLDKLTVNGAIGIRPVSGTATLRFWGGDTTSYTLYADAGDNFIIRDSSNGTNRILIDDEGNVGIGTNNPSTKLDVNGNIYFDGDLNVTGSISSPSTTDISPLGLVLDLNFNINSMIGDDVFLDSSGYNNHGTNNGAEYNSTAGFNGGGAYEFTGIGESLSVPNDDSLKVGTSDYTIIARIYPTNFFTSRVPIISKLTGARDKEYALSITDAGEVRLEIERDGNDGMVTSVGAGIELVNWYDVVATFDVSTKTVSLYVNGIEQTTTGSITTLPVDTNYDLMIGDDLYESAIYHGTIDELRIYNRILTDDEIMSYTLRITEELDAYVLQKDIKINTQGDIVGDYNITGALTVDHLTVTNPDSINLAGAIISRFNTSVGPTYFTGVNIDDSLSIRTNKTGSLTLAVSNYDNSENSNSILSAVNAQQRAFSMFKFNSNYSIPSLGTMYNSQGKLKILGQKDSNDSLSGIEFGFTDGVILDPNFQITGFANQTNVMEIFNDSVSIYTDLILDGNITIGDGDFLVSNGVINAYGPGGAITNFVAGLYAGQSLTDGFGNVLIGYEAGVLLTTEDENTFVGMKAGLGATGLSEAIAIGHYALENADGAYRTIALGREAGKNANGVDSLYLGYEAGEDNDVHDKLFISNTLGDLIEGDFANNWLKIYGNLTVQSNGASTNVIVARSSLDKDLLWVRQSADGDGSIHMFNKTGLQTVTIQTDGADSYFNGGGKVGIGTSSPDTLLSVAGNVIIGQDVTSGISQLMIGEEAEVDKGIVIEYDHDNVKAYFRLNGDSSPLGLTIDNGGNIGIGTDEPEEKLHVVGDLFVEGGVRFNDTFFTDAGHVGIGINNTQSKFQIYDSTSTTEDIAIIYSNSPNDQERSLLLINNSHVDAWRTIPLTVNQEAPFATALRVLKGSLLIESGADLTLDGSNAFFLGGSGLYLEGGGEMRLEGGSHLNIFGGGDLTINDSNSHIYLEEGADLHVLDTGNVYMEDGHFGYVGDGTFSVPVKTQAQIDSVSKSAGMIFFNSDYGVFQGWDGSSLRNFY